MESIELFSWMDYCPVCSDQLRPLDDRQEKNCPALHGYFEVIGGALVFKLNARSEE